MGVSAMPIPRFASGVPRTDIGFLVFVGRFMGTGRRVGTPTYRRYAQMFSTWSKTKRANEIAEGNSDLSTEFAEGFRIVMSLRLAWVSTNVNQKNGHETTNSHSANSGKGS
jgi:hypothetical protein